jgi:signal transduction histidine kinase
LDVLIPLAVGWFLLAVVFDEYQHDHGPVFAVGIALAIGQAVALRWRRSHPGLVMIITIVGGAGSALIAPTGLFPVAGLVAIGTFTALRPPRQSVPALLALLGIVALTYPANITEDIHFAMAVVVLVWALAEAFRNHRIAVGQQADRAVAEERARISRELHDVLAHSVSVIVVQAAAADDVFDTRPDQARTALRSIETAGREALGDLRRLLAAVRLEAAAASPPTADPPTADTRTAETGTAGTVGAGGDPARPSPGLDRLDEVTGPLWAAGLEVVVRREGPVRPVPPGVDLSAYRIVQEALTNTLRHARATRADVELRYGDDVLEVDVRDDGRGGAPDGRTPAGLGLVGMRERAAILGGRLEAGPSPAGGYRVHARIPLEPIP